MMKNATHAPFIVGLGGTMRQGSSTEMALRIALSAAAARGARTQFFGGAELDLPMYNPQATERSSREHDLIESLRACDGVIIGSPGYHGSISGLVKNALDYTEDLRTDPLPYFDGRAVGCIACAAGPQAGGTTLAALRAITHALRGWPTPLGVCINTNMCKFLPDGSVSDPEVAQQLRILGTQVFEFAQMRNLQRISKVALAS